ncbi:MAG TPA: BMP family ABC transporter substrate-binding protein [Pseudogracilibacillus sp.]|nr:BMP family ABC transporter substrate-binding protein [Pseudogracilibacillus sp.]
MNRKICLLSLLLLILSTFLAACNKSNNDLAVANINEHAEPPKDENALSVALVTDTGGINDRSFNQFAWEGLQAWGETYSKKEGREGYDFILPEKETDEAYVNSFEELVNDGTDLMFGVGFLLEDAVYDIASQYEDHYFASIDTVVPLPNVVSITFAEHEGSFLAGLAAAEKTQTKKVGFIGGVDSDLIQKFEVGYSAGIHTIDPKIEVDIQYVEDFNDVETAQQLAKEMYDNGVDIIYHAAGNAGNGVFAEATARQAQQKDNELWVIGVDRDQYEEGFIENSNESVTLTSMVKRVDLAVYDVASALMSHAFPGGEILVFGLADEGIALTNTNEQAYTNEIAAVVNDWQEKVIKGEITVPKSRAELKDFEQGIK